MGIRGSRYPAKVFFNHAESEERREILSNMLERLGIRCEKNPDLSERFCKACAGKLRRTYEGFNFIASNIIAPNPEFGLEEVEDEAAALFRTKRTIPISFSTPERSPNPKKKQRTADRGNTTVLGGKDGKSHAFTWQKI